MCNQRLFSSCPTSRPRRRGPPGWRGALLCLVTIWAGGAASDDLPEIAGIPMFLLSGADPNVILTIDDSNSMNQAFLPEKIWGPTGDAYPQFDARDISSLTNRQYYDPAQTYLPPLYADGSSFGNAEFDKALVDAFHSTCKLNLGEQFAPTWNLMNTGSDACADLTAATAAAIKNVYAADIGHSEYPARPESKNKFLHGQEWAWRCMVVTKDCPAVYYRLKQSDTACTGINPEAKKAVDYKIEDIACLERVVVGSDDDHGKIYKWNPDKKVDEKIGAWEDVTTTVQEERERLLNKNTLDPYITDAGALAKRNFANWFSYYRTRFLTLQTVLPQALDGYSEKVRFSYQDLRAMGQYTADTLAFIELKDRFLPYRDNQNTFFTWLFAQRADSKTNLVSAAARVHEFFRSDTAYLDNPRPVPDGTTNPLWGCRTNKHVMFTDGYWEDWIRVSSVVEASGFIGLAPPTEHTDGDPQLWLGNNDATSTPLPVNSAAVTTAGLASPTYNPTLGYARIFADGNTGMLADVVFTSWITDLRTGSNDPAAPNQVPIPPPRVQKLSTETPVEFFWNYQNDPADWQHVNTTVIGLGVGGNVNYPGGSWTYGGSSGTVQLNGFPGNWNAIGGTAASPNANLVPSPVKIDDSWHAGINGRGGYLSAGDPTTLIKAFREALDPGTSEKDSSAAAAAVNTGATASEDVVYQARLNSADWSGDIRSYQVSAGLGKEPCPTLDIHPGQLCQDPSTGQYYQSAAHAMRELLPDNRRIFTAANGTGKAFTWDNLTSTQKLDFLADDGDITTAQLRLAYVAGDRTHEVDGATPQFRKRATLCPTPPCSCSEPFCTNLLGDFINAAPVLVGAPAYFYNAPGYQGATGFKQAHQDRTPLVYAGANDGMLHAFAADTLQEVFAFIPPVLMELARVEGTKVPGLNKLSTQPYVHQNYVDGPIATGDVRFGTASQGGWHTVLIGALGKGAQGLYSLDVTTVPAAAATVDTVADQLYHWQFIDRDETVTTVSGQTTTETVIQGDPDLGNIFGRPAIVRVRGSLIGRGAEPTWVAIIGNGYNSDRADGSRNLGCDDTTPDVDETDANACGQAVLYVIAIDTGKVVKKFSTGVGRNDDPLNIANIEERRSNALGQATIVTDSVHTDGDLLADFAYAADLFGNVYRFDLTGSSTNEIRTLFSAVAPTIGTTAGSAQPITSPVAVARHPLGLGTLVLFGTGQYLYSDDDPRDRQQVQSFYAIWDTGSDDQATVARTRLLQQEFTTTEIVVKADESAAATEVTRGRTSSANLIDWSTHLGWYIDFDIEEEANSNLNKGERVVTEPEVQGGRVIFVSLVPETNPCVGGGYSWINSLDVRNGSRLGLTPFDFNLDGSITEADLLTISGEPVVGTSVRLTPGGKSTGIYSSPSSFGDGAGRITTVVSTSEGDLVLINAADIQAWRVWQQLR